MPLARHQPHLLIPLAQNNQAGKNKNPRNEIKLPTNRIVLLSLCTQNPRLRKVDFEPSPMTCSDRINMQKKGRNTQKKASPIVQARLIYGSQQLERRTWNPVLRQEPIGQIPSELLQITSKLAS